MACPLLRIGDHKQRRLHILLGGGNNKDLPERCMHVYDVKIFVGNAGPFLYACIRYETGEISLAWIIGLVVGIVVLLILITAVAVVCVYRRRSRQKKIADSDSNELEMSPVAADRRPSAEG